MQEPLDKARTLLVLRYAGNVVRTVHRGRMLVPAMYPDRSLPKGFPLGE